MTDLDHYQVLGLATNATSKEIRKRYKKLCQKYHPDKNPENADHFMLIRRAYDVLIDPQRRVIYDQGIRQGINPEEFKTTLFAFITKLLPLILSRLVAHGGNFEQSAQFELTTQKSEIAGERAKAVEAQRIVNKYLKSIKSGHESYFAQALIKKNVEINVVLQHCDVALAVIKFLSDDTKNILCEEEVEELPRQLTEALHWTRV